MKWIVLLVLACVLAWLIVSLAVDQSLRRAGLAEGRGFLKMAHKHYLEHGYTTNFGDAYQLWETTNTVAVNGTNYQCAFTVDVFKFYDRGVLSMTTNGIFIWQDKKHGAKIIPQGYRTPFFPPVF